MQKTKVLLIDDDQQSCQMLHQYLTHEGFNVEFCCDGKSGLIKEREWQPQLIVLDVMMPELDGFAVLRRLRDYSQVAVLMLTARQDDIDKVLGLEFGADDYLVKPYNPRELVARIKAIVRRTASVEPTEQQLQRYDLTLDLTKRQLLVNSQPIEVTLSEFMILHELLKHWDTVMTKEQLSLSVLKRPLEIYDRSIDMHISNLRKKIASSQVTIATTRSVGYRLTKSDQGH